MATPHIGAEDGQIAPLVLMPGDPRRATRIADLLLQDAELVTEVRGILGYTGTYQGRRMTVMASGMGIPSITIYATELFRFYGVQRIVRVGTAGAITTKVALGDVVVASHAHTDSSVATLQVPGVNLSAGAAFPLLQAAISAKPLADGPASAVHVGPVVTSDHFYLQRPAMFDVLEQLGTLAVEMEAAGLYFVAAAEARQALAITTITDHLRTGEAVSAQDRETRFAAMVDRAAQALLTP